jgi:uncharacterized protein YxjI
MTGDLLKRIDFSDDNYTVKQSFIRNKYAVYDSSGEKVIGAKQKLFKMKEEFPFTDAEGNIIFRIKAKRRLDIAGDYGIIDEETGETVAILTKEFSFFKHIWRIKDPETEALWATIESRGKMVGLIRTLSDIADFLPHKYTIYNSDRDEIGKIKGQWSLRDTYNVELGELGKVPREAVVAAACTIDALEAN